MVEPHPGAAEGDMNLIALAIFAVGMEWMACQYKDVFASLCAMFASIAFLIKVLS